MVVLPVFITLFIHRHVPSKLVPRNKVACNQVFYRVVNSSTAHTVLFIFHAKMQLLCIKMFIIRIYFIQYGKPLRCFAALALLKILCKNFFYSLLLFLLFHHTSLKSQNNEFL